MKSTPPPAPLLYAGTHRRAYRADPIDIAHGIYGFRRAPTANQLHACGLTPALQPGWVASHPCGRFLYAVHEVRDFDGTDGGGVSAYLIDQQTGALRLLNTQPTTALPCHCAVDASGCFLLVATFGGGAVHLFPLQDDGRIGAVADFHQHHGVGVHPHRQLQPHAHGICMDPSNRWVLVPDLGIDQVLVYELDAALCKLRPLPERTVRVAAGSGPRHLVFGHNPLTAYLLNEISATVTVFGFDSTNARLQEMQTVDLLPAHFAGHRSGAALAMHPNEKFLYATTRSHGSSGEPAVRGIDSLVWFRIDALTGRLQPQGSVPTGGEIPRDFALDATGGSLYVAHQASSSIVHFKIDPATGAPSMTGVAINTPVPTCLCLIPSSASL